MRRREVAEIKPSSATQGKTWSDNEDCCAAAYAIDGDLSTGSVTHTDNGAGWLKIQLDGTSFILKIAIYYRFYTNWFVHSDECVNSEVNFKKCVDNDNNVDVSVYQGKAEILWNTPTNIRTRTVRSDLHNDL